jgi:hypothetical protein
LHSDDPREAELLISDLSTMVAALRAQPDKPFLNAEEYLRYKYGAYRGFPAWREIEEGYNQGRYDEAMAQGPDPYPSGAQPETFGLSMSMFANKQDYEAEKNQRARERLDSMPVADHSELVRDARRWRHIEETEWWLDGWDDKQEWIANIDEVIAFNDALEGKNNV